MADLKRGLTPHEHASRALAIMARRDRSNYRVAHMHLNKACQLDPTYARPRAWLADWHCLLLRQHWTTDRTAEAGFVEREVQQAIRLDRTDPDVLVSLARFQSLVMRNHLDAAVTLDLAVQKSPCSSAVHAIMGRVLSHLGHHADARDHILLAKDFSLHDMERASADRAMASSSLLAGNYEDAVKYGRSARERCPNDRSNLIVLIRGCYATGRTDEISILLPQIDAMAHLSDIICYELYQNKSVPEHTFVW